MSKNIGEEGLPRVVILGSGYAGAECAKILQKKLGSKIVLTVVDKRKANIHKIASARAAVLGRNYCDRVLMPNDKLVIDGKGTLIYKTIKSITSTEVELNDRTLGYDYLVCATGAINYSICEPPLHIVEREDMKKFYGNVHDIILESQNIIIVGGGATGLELAGEIKYEYPSKNITIVHSRETLLNRVTPTPSKGFIKKVQSKLEKSGVRMVMGERLEADFASQGNKPYIFSKGGVYKTDKGTELTGDLVMLCGGKKVNNAIYPQEWLDEYGQVKVRPTLQIEGFDNIYAVGDVNNVKENKLAVVSGFQADRCAANITLQVNGKKKLKKYVPGFGFNKTFIFITNGRTKGTGFLGVQTVGNLVVSNAKCKDLFTTKNWKVYGRKPPMEQGGASKGGKNPANVGIQSEPMDLGAFFDTNDTVREEKYQPPNMSQASPPVYHNEVPPAPIAQQVQEKEEEPLFQEEEPATAEVIEEEVVQPVVEKKKRRRKKRATAAVV